MNKNDLISQKDEQNSCFGFCRIQKELHDYNFVELMPMMRKGQLSFSKDLSHSVRVFDRWVGYPLFLFG